MAAPVYRFLPWARSGLARAITDPETFATLPARTSIAVHLDIDGTTTPASSSIDLYGPGEVTGIDRRVILRTDPAPSVTDFEPNYLAMIEFDAPELPWLFSPAAAVGDQLRPWCVLVVVERQLGVTMSLRADTPLPILTIANPADARNELPDLNESWAWAHAQILEESGSPTAVGADPDRDLSRLVCPRRLKAETSYYACVVPAFDAGIARGLGQVVTATEINPAWDAATQGIRLPLYFFWEFSTAVEDDIESMARRLHGPEHAPPNLGERRVYAAAGHPDLFTPPLAESARIVTMHGALRQVDASPPDASTQDPELAGRIAEIVDRRDTRDLPAPIYGEWPAAQHTVAGAPTWMGELNSTVAHRIAAGLGAEVVRRNQEAFVQTAWDQVGEVRAANELAHRARLAAAVLDRVATRHIVVRPDARLLQLAAPILRTIAVTPAPRGTATPTIGATVDDASVPTGAASAAYRRMVSGQRQAVKLGVRRSGLVPGEGLIALTAVDAAMAEPAPGPPDGVVGLRDLAALRTSRRSPTDDTVSLEAIGLPGRAAFANVERLRPVKGPVGLLQTAGRPLFAQSELAALISTVTGRPTRTRIEDPPIKRAPKPVADVPSRNVFSGALIISAKAVNRATPAAQFVVTDLGGLSTRLRARLDPRVNIARRVNAMVSVATPAPATPPYDPYRGIRPFPVIGDSTYQYLDQLPGGWVLPEANGLEPDTAILLRTNSDFIAAFLVGVNVEMNSELLWRGYPTDQRGTPFQHFWDRFDHRPDISPVHQWTPTAALADAGVPEGVPTSSSGGGDQIVLLIRGKLLRRYPDMVIYATVGTHNEPGTTIEAGGRPMFFAHLAPDLSVVGFPLTPSQLTAAEWWFVLEQQLTAPRFGFEGDDPNAPPPASWADVSWSALAIEPGLHIKLSDPHITGANFGGRPFGSTADQIASSLLQRPIRVALHRDRLLTHPGGTS